MLPADDSLLFLAKSIERYELFPSNGGDRRPYELFIYLDQMSLTRLAEGLALAYSTSWLRALSSAVSSECN